MNDAPARSSFKRRHRSHPNARRAQSFVPWPSATACGISAVAIAFSGTLCWMLHQEIRRQRTVEAPPDESFSWPETLDELLPLPSHNSVDPCLDFHGFVCRRQGARRSNVFRRAYANVLLDWAAVFHGTDNGHLESHQSMVKTLYRSCMPPLLKDGEAERQAAVFLGQWGDMWKTIRDNAASHDLVQAVLSLAIAYNISTVLNVKLTLALAKPMFFPEGLRFVNYARIGALIAGELYGSVLGYPEPEHLGNNETKPDGFPTTQRSCFEKLYFGNSNGSITSTAILDRVLSLSLGLETVWEIVQDDLQDTHIAFVGREEMVTRTQMFFLRYCATWCGYYEWDDWNRWSCNVPVQNVMAFHAAFKCPAPVTRCLP
ncbi:unnamed protein product [Ixodes hexagonus]